MADIQVVCCSFLLQLSLLDLDCAGYPNSLLAASALSVALDSFGKEPWPMALQQYSAYLPNDIEPVRVRLKVWPQQVLPILHIPMHLTCSQRLIVANTGTFVIPCLTASSSWLQQTRKVPDINHAVSLCLSQILKLTSPSILIYHIATTAWQLAFKPADSSLRHHVAICTTIKAELAGNTCLGSC